MIDVNLYGGIRFNTIRPGPTKTEIHEPGRIGRITPLLPMGRPGEPQEIAETILFLLSDMASYISGATLNVSGARKPGARACDLYLVFGAWLPMIAAETHPHNKPSLLRE